MAARIARRKIAALVADQLLAGRPAAQALQSAAAYLIASRRTREQELLVRDIEDALAVRGVVVANVVTARPLATDLSAAITDLTGAASLQLRHEVDTTVLGGIRIDVPGKRFDGTIRRKLNALKAKQL